MALKYILCSALVAFGQCDSSSCVDHLALVQRQASRLEPKYVDDETVALINHAAAEIAVHSHDPQVDETIALINHAAAAAPRPDQRKLISSNSSTSCSYTTLNAANAQANYKFGCTWQAYNHCPNDYVQDCPSGTAYYCGANVCKPCDGSPCRTTCSDRGIDANINANSVFGCTWGEYNHCPSDYEKSCPPGEAYYCGSNCKPCNIFCPTPSPTPLPTPSPTQYPTQYPTPYPTSSPTASPTSSPTDSPTASPTSSPTSSPTDSPTASPTSSPTPSLASASGDPHMTNLLGERFDVNKVGTMEFLRVPYESVAEKANFTVFATIKDVSGSLDECTRALYITSARFGGAWLGDHGVEVSMHNGEMVVSLAGVRMKPSLQPVPIGSMLQLHFPREDQLHVRIGAASVDISRDIQQAHFFLNMRAASLRNLGCKIGGLLGEDSHDHVSKAPSRCQVSLLATPREASRSVASASLGSN